MVAGLLDCVVGSISNRTLASNIKNNWPFQNNNQKLAIECLTKHHLELLDLVEISNNLVDTFTINRYGMSGFSMGGQQCVHSYKPRIGEVILRSEERAAKKGNTNKIQLTTMFPTGTSSTFSPIVSAVGKKLGLTNIMFSVLPNDLSEKFQLINAMYGLSISSFQPIVLVDEAFAELVSDETKARAGLAAGGEPSNFYIISQYMQEFSCKIAKLLSGDSKTKNTTTSNNDELSFLDVEKEFHRNQSGELESAIGGRQELFVMHYARSCNNNFQEMGVLKPNIMANCPKDPICIVEYNSRNLSEGDVASDLIASLENQDLQPERLLYIPSDHNELISLIPTKIPNRLKNLIDYVKKNRELKDVLNNWARKTILSNIPPIRRGSERRILKDRLSQIFYDDKSQITDYAKSQGFSMKTEDLMNRNILFYLSEKEDVHLRPLEV